MYVDLACSHETELSPQPPQSAGDDLEIPLKKDGVTAEEDADCELAVDEDYEIFRQYLLNLADAFRFVAEFLREQSARPPRKIKYFFRELKRREIDADIIWFKHAKTRVEMEGRSLYEIWNEWPAYKDEKTNADDDSGMGVSWLQA